MARHYFDPRSGDPISGDEFIRRYTVNAFMFVEHPRERVEQATAPGLTKYGPVCRGCGTSVEHEGDLCDNCVDKPHLQRAMFETAPQPRPAYEQREQHELREAPRVDATNLTISED